MPEQEHLDELIANSLSSQAGLVQPREGAEARIRNELVYSAGRGRKMYGRKLNWKIAVLAVTCIVLLASNIVLVTSHSAHTWAAEIAGGILKKAQKISGTPVPADKDDLQKVTVARNTEDGEKKVEERVESGVFLLPENVLGSSLSDIAKNGGSSSFAVSPSRKKMKGIAVMTEDMNLTLEEAMKRAGFAARLPEYLPQGYDITTDNWVATNFLGNEKGKPKETGNRTLFIQLNSGGGEMYQGARLMITPDETEAGNDMLSHNKMQIGGYSVIYTETEITAKIKSEPGKMATIIEKEFYWSDGELHYTLTDYAGVSFNDLVKMIGSMK